MASTPPQYNVVSLTYQIFSLSRLSYDGFWLSFPILLIGFGWLLFRHFYYSLLFLCLFGVLLPLLLMLPIGGTEDLLNNQRYFSFLTPFYLILLAQGVVAIFELVLIGLSRFSAAYRRFSTKQLCVISIVPTLLLSALMFSQVISIYNADQVYKVQKDYVDYTIDFLVQNLQPEDVVVVAAPKLQGKDRPQELSRNGLIVETFVSRMSSNRGQDTSVLSHFIEFEQLDSLNELRRLQSSTANIWLMTSLDGTVPEQKAKKQQLDAVTKDGLVVNCFDVICLVGFDNSKTSNQYDRLQKQLTAAVFLNSGFANKAEELAAMDVRQLKQLPFKNENQNVVALSKQPYYVGLPVSTSVKSQTFCVKYKYRGTLSRVFVGAQDDKGNNIAILPDWDGYYPRPTSSVFSDWHDEGFIFKAPPGTTRATLVLLAETNLAEAKDFELFEVLTEN